MLALGAVAMAAPKPMVLTAVYDDSISSDLKVPKDSKSCQLKIASLIDERRSPEMIGVYGGRAIHAPEDRDAWLRSMVVALKSRKIKVTFAGTESEAAGALNADIALTKAWIANTETNMSASIVFRVKMADASGVMAEQSYRGGASHMSYWSGGPSELQRAFDTAVARVLDEMAASIHKNCGVAA